MAVSKAATPAGGDKIGQLEKRVQALEEKLANTEKLLMEFADEIALLNVKMTTLEGSLPQGQ
jgi:uncharacterized coiled-coil protein SlyX